MAKLKDDNLFEDDLGLDSKPKKKRTNVPVYKSPPKNENLLERAREEMKKEAELDVAQRNLKGTRKVHHDLFKLKSTTFLKNLGLPSKPHWIPTEHCHFFHTRDSNGRLMTHASSIGGHTHRVTVKVVDGLFVAECGPAEIKVKGDRVVQFPNDQHTHEIEYLWSEEVEARKMNQSAAKVMEAYQKVFNVEEKLHE